MEREPAIDAKVLQTPAEHSRVSSRVSASTRLAILASIAFGVALASLMLANPPRAQGTVVHTLIVSYILGTTLGLPAMAAFWSTMGPGPFAFRAPLSLLCIAGIAGALFSNQLIYADGPRPQEIVVLSIAAIGAWFVPQGPLWCFRSLARVSVTEIGGSSETKENQFGIGQLLILTTLIAVVLGGVRLAVISVDGDFAPGWRVFFILGAFVASAVILSHSLASATLRSRYALLTALCVLALGALATFVEIEAIKLLGGGLVLMDFRVIPFLNGTVAMWSLVFSLMARRCGFRLVRAA